MTVKVIADSVSPQGHRLTTMTVELHRFILPEFNTHRAFSRNSASNRARPISKVIEAIQKNIAFPYRWGKNKSGMQATEVLSKKDEAEAKRIWKDACENAIDSVRELDALGVHKEIANRLIEPFMWNEVVVSATDFDNFFDLRCSDLAQREIALPAELMREALAESTPVEIGYDGWHTPFILDSEYWLPLEVKKQASAARCARVSYKTFDGVVDVSKDLQLFERLADPGDGKMHSSPFEHVARPLQPHEVGSYGNFNGWMQMRHVLEMK